MNYYTSNSDDFNIEEYHFKNSETLLFKKKKLIEICKNLAKNEYLEIYNIILKDSCPYSENKNGIFVNLANIKETTIDKIFDFINFIKHKKEDLIIQDEKINTVKLNINEHVNNDINNNTNNLINDENSDEDNNDTESLDYSEEKSSKNYLSFSSDEDDNLENKLSLKKKSKNNSKKMKIIKSFTQKELN